MMWDAPFVEFYYPALSDETHVTVDIGNAAETFAALRHDRQRQQKLLANAERVSQELLCPSCLESYWRKLIRRYRSYFRLDAVLDDRETLRRLLAGLDVAKLKLVALDVSTKWKLVSPRFLTDSDQLRAIADDATVDPEATPAPAKMWKTKRAKKKKASETAEDITDAKRRAAKKWLRGVTGCLGLQC